uniref:Uncharacterized protein n=1 Tax=Phasianus colchicus TaxID=9054 RepID=A0A669QYC1_PHACC
LSLTAEIRELQYKASLERALYTKLQDHTPQRILITSKEFFGSPLLNRTRCINPSLFPIHRQEKGLCTWIIS